MSSPNKLKQLKITAFCSKSVNSQQELSSARMNNRKRKNETEIFEVHKTPTKKPVQSNLTSPNLLNKKPKLEFCTNDCFKKDIEKIEFEDFDLEDFENDFTLSPVKKGIPKKGVLSENQSENDKWEEKTSEITFETPVKCKVAKTKFLTNKNFEQILLLNDVASNKTGICRLREIWTSFSFSNNDIVCIQATRIEGMWVVNNKAGYVILNPDVLITSTTLTGLMFCMRKGVLSQHFKELDPQGNNRMLIGRLVHEFFQESLKVRPSSDNDFGRIITSFIQSRKNLRDLYFSGISVAAIEKEMKNFIPNLKNFLSVYFDKKAAPPGQSFNGSVEEVMDIEELIQSPNLGFQGRIDVTVKIKSKNVEKIAPLELKTGKATFSKEHRSQLIMYILLMNELGRNVDSGLLLYLKEGSVEEVLPGRDEIRNLFLLRNHFVRHFRDFQTGNLPDPIRNKKGCVKCPLVRICTTYLKSEEEKLSETHPLKSMDFPDMKQSHLDYFLKWSKILRLEFEDVSGDVVNHSEVSHLLLKPNIENLKKEYKCCFLKTEKSDTINFRPGAFVNVMSGKNVQICSGRIHEITDSFISVLTDKKLQNFSDSYSLVAFKSKLLNFYLTNLGWFLHKNFEFLRELIIDKKVPNFDESLDKGDFEKKCLSYLLRLNKEQRKAVLKSLLCQDYVLIKGPPGTGKTQTVVTLIKVLLELNQTVLIAGHTHSSVDNILLKLDGVQYLRLGSLKSIHEDVQKNSYDFLIENCSNVDDVKKLFGRKLFASTCMGIDSDFVNMIKVDYCIVDESSQVLQPEVLRPLFCCKKFILVGDEDQLSPVVRSLEAKKQGLSESIFEWLSTDHATVKLRLQYRMNSVINTLANTITYKGLLECGNEEVAQATIKFSNREAFVQEDEWVVRVLSDKLENSVVFVDTSEYFRFKNSTPEGKRCSVLEANVIVKLIKTLVKFGLKEENIGVITPFWDQIALLSAKLMDANLKNIELNTVDQYQGRDKEIILLSCTKENLSDLKATEKELLSDQKRLTVAVTRAKHKLIIVGDKQSVSKYKPFEKLIQSMNDGQIFSLSNGMNKFFWHEFDT